MRKCVLLFIIWVLVVWAASHTSTWGGGDTAVTEISFNHEQNNEVDTTMKTINSVQN